MLAVLAGLGLSGLQLWLARRPRLAVAAVAGAAALTALVAVRIAPRGAPPFPRTLAYAPLEVERLRALGWSQEPGFQRVFWAERTEKIRPEEDLDVVFDLENLVPVRKAQMLTFLVSGTPEVKYVIPGADLEKVPPTTPFSGRLALPPTGERAAILDLLSADLVATRKPHPWLDQRYRLLTRGSGQEKLYANPHALPHAYRVSAGRAGAGGSAPGPGAPDLAGFDPRRRVMLHGVDPLPPTRPGEPGRVEVELREDERVLLRTAGAEPGFVVLTDAWFPGWEARVNGEPAPLLRANTLFPRGGRTGR